MSGNYGREQAWALLTEWTAGESLRKHALAVEACVAAYGEAEADRLGLEGEERAAMLALYQTTALLHDFDYERHPSLEEHPFVGVSQLDQQGWPQPPYFGRTISRMSGHKWRRRSVGRFLLLSGKAVQD